MDEEYVNGFVKRCEEVGIDPEALVKAAKPPVDPGLTALLRYLRPQGKLRVAKTIRPVSNKAMNLKIVKRLLDTAIKRVR